ncbi:MAG: YlxR family protein [Peptococcaceae bacterium]|nr:YlxR family protein [Peptococcaceae bacterium]
MPKIKRIPQRLCVGCQEMKPKKELLRIVRTPDEGITIDQTGKRAGRGVYICLNPECLKIARKGKRIEKALKTPIPPDVYGKIEEEVMH